MRRFLVPFVAAAAIAALIFQAGPAASRNRSVLEFGSMAPVTGPFVGSANPIRGINGGGLPWQIRAAHGELSSDGKLEVEVRGLVLFDGPPVPEARRGTNPIANFDAIMSCLSIENGNPTTVNVTTPLFPATSTGNAEIEARLTMPHPCIAPIIFVGPSATTWFAATGS
ncbi:MAG TPA: hypothetical protein VGW79_01730 [Actinomycetota bacterium]|nr:hypothetical protein [Actinomycetota bacterium]